MTDIIDGIEVGLKCPNCGLDKELVEVRESRIYYDVAKQSDGSFRRTGYEHGEDGDLIHYICADCGSHWGGQDGN